MGESKRKAIIFICMNICLINSLYEPNSRGGAEVAVKNIAYLLKEAGCSVTVITLGRSDEKAMQDAIPVFRIKPANIFSFLDIQKKHFLLRFFWHPMDALNMWSARKIKKILLELKPDIVYTHNLKGIGYLVPKIIKKLKIKHIHHLHDVQLSRPSGIILFHQEKPFLFLDKAYEKICRYLFGSPDIIISPSQWLMDYHTVRGFFYNSKKFVLQNPAAKAKKFSEDRASRQGSGVFLYVGQLEGSKGILFLIDILKKIKQPWSLKIVGSGSLEKRIRDEIQGDPRFQFYGYVKHSSLGEIFLRSDYTIVPSLVYENSPSVIFESLTHGVPVIASDIGGIPEIICDNFNGYVFEPGNEKNLRTLIEFLMAHPEERRALAANALASVENFQGENFKKKFLEIIGASY